jgi:uncharacterized protein involved in cysteine biosynthesis
MIFTAFFRAIGDLFEGHSIKVLAKGVGLALAMLIAAYIVVAKLVGFLVPDTLTLPFIGPVTWVEDLASWGSVLLMMVLSVFLMAPVASAFIGLFIEEVADAVEDRHYPNLPALTDKPLSQTISESIKFFGVVLGANLIALALMVIPLFWPFAPFIFTGVNGYLLGREYFQMVALRRMNPPEAKALFERHKLTIVTAGVLMAIPLAVPVVNLVVPVLGAASFTHLYHQIVRRR